MRLSKAQMHEIYRLMEDWEADQVTFTQTQGKPEVKATIRLTKNVPPNVNQRISVKFDVDGNEL
jgi:hypothetical protein